MADKKNSRRIIPWLTNALDTNRYYPILRWFDRENKIFEIQWCHQRRTGWSEKYIKLFEAWAKHKGRFQNQQEPKTLKLTFRNALRSKKTELKRIKPPNGCNELCQYWRIIKPEADCTVVEEPICTTVNTMDEQSNQSMLVQKRCTEESPFSQLPSFVTFCQPHSEENILQSAMSNQFQSVLDFPEELINTTYDFMQKDSLSLFEGILDFQEIEVNDENERPNNEAFDFLEL